MMVKLKKKKKKIRDRSQTLVGGVMQKNVYRKNFSGPPIRPQKNFRAPLFAMKITGQPQRKTCKLYF